MLPFTASVSDSASLFKNAIYGVQIGDYPYLKNFADEVIPAINAVIAEKIRLLFEKF